MENRHKKPGQHYKIFKVLQLLQALKPTYPEFHHLQALPVLSPEPPLVLAAL
ncbi:hypothetical protein A51 [Sulfolobus turreted icosahedral virus 1]|uniref:Uncharacterized protein n=1 Tax=Sulfolobus turreted icosahedral virus 1 TaxID=269145 RepID=Q6Q0I8_9VIRU|nr:hypothetical protein A51 [Sulfolobus turreted icosahedral virus 1]AAS89103.1 hypothetical protein A51 [Sulfolobus turreted icosahedral virus 1]